MYILNIESVKPIQFILFWEALGGGGATAPQPPPPPLNWRHWIKGTH